MNFLVGTEKTSAKSVSDVPYISREGMLTVQLLEGELLGFSDEAEDHEPGDEIKSSVEAD